MADLTNQQELILQRMANRLNAGEGALVPPGQVGFSRVPLVSNLQVLERTPRNNGTLFTLGWQDVNSPNVDHYNIFVTNLSSNVIEAQLAVQVNKAPAVIFANYQIGTPLLFTVQTVLKTGLSSGINISPSIGSNSINGPNQVLVRLSNNQNIPNGGGAINWDTDLFNPNPIMHSLITNTSRLIAPVSGNYVIIAGINWGLTVAGTTLAATILVNGTTNNAEQDILSSGGAHNDHVNISGVVNLNALDYVEIIAGQNSGVGINAQGTVTTRASMVQIVGSF